WNSLPYIGLGAGAASWQNPVRSQNLLSPEEYCEAILNCSPAFTEQQTCTPQTTLFDCLMMALRLEQKGANSNLVKEISGLDPIVHYEKIWQQLIGQGLIEFVGDDGEKYIRPTKAGILQLDTILCQLLPDDNQLTV
ncbi:MAG: hypothetical protein QGF46_07315, partial [Planctomycetota bacterium]|nr:hypothetical protein [Planctomycetota bacterium]